MATVFTRVWIGSVLIVAIVGLLTIDKLSGHGYGAIALVMALGSAGLVEFARMVHPRPVASAGLVLAGAGYLALLGLGYELEPRLHLLLAPWAVLTLYALFFWQLRGAPSAVRFEGLGLTVLGFVYMAFLSGFTLELRFLGPEVGPSAFFFAIAMAKGTDICAFFAGKAFGKKKLVPSVSPGKSTAGFYGAVAGGALIAVLFSVFSPLGKLIPLSLAPGFGVVLSLVVISGDLIESFFKRSAEVKDSASLLPGFGGVLDIVDSVVIVAPAIYFGLYALSAFVPPGTPVSFPGG
ncbi:MAG: phosphatidate cytidylyltransferase [Planctomycetes bacterium]|nr:phosphatidate cytidylyltransferase [Planctomycetota bacterium]